MTSASIFETIKSGDFEAFQKLLSDAPELGNSFDEELQVSALLLAVYYRRKEFVEHLLSLGVVLDIWEAAAMGDQTRVGAILEEEPGIVNEYSPDGFSPLGLAAYFGHPDLMEFLIGRGAEINRPSQNAMRVYPINSAGANRDPEVSLAMLKILIGHGAEVDAAQHGGITALHEAAHHGHVEKAQVLLAAGANPEQEAEDGRTPIQMAKEAGHKEFVDLLTSAGEG